MVKSKKFNISYPNFRRIEQPKQYGNMCKIMIGVCKIFDGVNNLTLIWFLLFEKCVNQRTHHKKKRTGNYSYVKNLKKTSCCVPIYLITKLNSFPIKYMKLGVCFTILNIQKTIGLEYWLQVTYHPLFWNNNYCLWLNKY